MTITIVRTPEEIEQAIARLAAASVAASDQKILRETNGDKSGAKFWTEEARYIDFQLDVFDWLTDPRADSLRYAYHHIKRITPGDKVIGIVLTKPHNQETKPAASSDDYQQLKRFHERVMSSYNSASDVYETIARWLESHGNR